ncbi:MAG TPA: hypothetical protein VG406_06405 [Isosphaeraceae bacterium]|jgi:hypothetical protein|nr:hypothetical protein [Isosphaeraceae bacterium]
MPKPVLKGKLTVAGAAAALVVASLAFVQGKGILFPDWSAPTKGTYQAPAGELGKKAAANQPWSVTTVTSSIQGKPVKGQPISVTGEVIDLSCYLQVGKHGDKHRDCGQKCARNGQPLGLLTQDGTVYMLIDEEHDPRRDGLTTLRKELIDHMAYVVHVQGTLTDVEGQKAIYVQGSVKGK